VSERQPESLSATPRSPECADDPTLSALADGDLGASEAERLRFHVGGCARCTRALDELEALARGLGELPAPEGEDNWSVLVNRLAADPPARLRLRAPAWWRRRWVIPSLAGLTLATLAGGGLRWHKGRGLSDEAVIGQAEAEFRAAEAHYKRAVEDLRGVAEKQREEWTPSKRAEYDAAQAQLEVAVARCRGVASERPADVDAEELLFAAYRKEIRFFEDQMMRGAR
jgi:putative zinc finger protein